MQEMWLVTGALLSFVASLLHVGIIIGGSKWYDFFGAGPKMVALAERGDRRAPLMTATIAIILAVWGLYALSGARVIMQLPFLTPVLYVITAVYTLRGLAWFPLKLLRPDLSSRFLMWSSLICLGIGGVHIVGLWLFQDAVG